MVHISRSYRALSFEDLEYGKSPFGGALVQHLDFGKCTVDATGIDEFSPSSEEPEALTIPPGPIEVILPDRFEPEQTLLLRGGPHHRQMEVQPPKWAKPGEALQLQLKPAPELRIQVPVGKEGGDQLQITGVDGKDLFADIPAGTRPGDCFDYRPTALMVAAPEGSAPGDFVVFRHHEVGMGGQMVTKYFRTHVPDELQFGRYFAARIPTKTDPIRKVTQNSRSLLRWGSRL